MHGGQQWGQGGLTALNPQRSPLQPPQLPNPWCGLGYDRHPRLQQPPFIYIYHEFCQASFIPCLWEGR